MNRNLVAAASVFALAAVGITTCSYRAPLATPDTVPVERASFEVRVETLGVLDAARSAQISSTVRGDRGKLVYVIDDGASVQAGDVLARFDATPFEADVLRLTGEVRAKEAMVEFARQNLEVEKSQVKKTLDNGEYDLIAARQEHARFLAYIDDLKGLVRKGYTVEGEIAQASRKEEELRTKLNKAETELGRLQKEAMFSVAKAAAELNRAESEVATSRAGLVTATRDLENSVLRAPAPGFVVLNEVFQGTAKRRPRTGDTVWQGQPIMYLPDLSAMVVKTQVREEDLHKLRMGQSATVRVEAYPDAKFEGIVSSVGVLAVENTAQGAAGKHFQLAIQMRSGDARLRPGMTARVTIVADHARGVVAIPVGALHYDGSQPTCYVYDGHSFTPRKVAVGRRGDDLLEITSGLREGERVSLARP
jgi:HlyD family secretion protein